MLRESAVTLNCILREAAGEKVEVRRGNDSAELTAYRGQYEKSALTEADTMTTWSGIDWIFNASEFEHYFDSPQRGDLIVDCENTAYQALPDNNNVVWRESGAGIRVHTKRIGKDVS